MRVRERHETCTLFALHLCAYELGRCCGSLLLRHWKEGCLVEEQVVTQTQELGCERFQTEVVRGLQGFLALASEWNRLASESVVDSMFLSHTWFQTWWESFGAGNELHIVTVRERGVLRAVAPMMRTRTPIYGLKLDTIQAIYNPHTPRYDFIVGGNQDAQLYRAIWGSLRSEEQADAIVVTQVPNASRTTSMIEQLGKRDGWITGQWQAPSSPFISLVAGYEGFVNSLKNSSRYNLRKRYDRLKKKGAVDVEVVANLNEVSEAMADGLRIEAAAWKGKHGTAIISDPAVAEFYVRLAERQAELEQVRLAFLRVGAKRIAFNYLLRGEKKLYGVKIGYDPAYHMYSPGNMLLNLILQQACAEGIEEYDFLGADEEWKFEWTGKRREHRWLFLFRDRLPNRLLHRLKFNVAPALKPWLKRLCTYLPGQV
jgi:GNAT acetyltransferase-like protein